MRKKRIMVIGPSRCGKTTLVNELNNYHGELRRTQDMIYGENTIDVPGSYIENSWMYKHIIAAAQDASHVLILVDQSKCTDVYSHGFAKSFRCPVIGVITKCDLMPENEENCLRQLKMIGVSEPYFHISFSNRNGIDALKKYLFETR
ncbi:EutP/PduV family microcompartment system protein [Clostridium chauvoei]|uniref:EutP/PduV family microcompartment system protein n=2 Tax=Clostridium chauvoei TaxID=46867 RepID=A0ABD4RGY6_9CLOT|nr:EutP/PduV family microcompartment system protein [Clostridium chauvoei]ATD55742.1 ethanolamine utilization protein EutP [Clostridium chauvoei]ATD56582.1 ethanolamine utilization protein EutP [Clostridium chauvoei]MBX7280287.1 EutP/PduV family microcompartment system protein [Clostridium chauvoei]MBX7282772.1 EutP/PduV family microcompartment system protein [Clostridium chauvoei]MBX7285178.1 EutP/PduV family microcompartment system protein [Clostridium chauvoei]